jgi:phospholipase/lecithinase/hemolysin
MTMTKRVGLALLLSSLACASAHATTPSYPAMYSFGDSLSDVGNVYALTGGVIPISPYYQGRFTNNLNWVDDLSVKLFGSDTMAPGLAGGNDFAWGGAQTGMTIVSNLGVPVPSVEAQVATFSTTSLPDKSAALYTFDIGANDILSALNGFKGGVITHDQMLNTFLPQAVGNALTAIEGLYTDGMRSLLYYEVPDLGVVPDYEALYTDIDGFNSATDAATLAFDFNTDLLKQVAAAPALSGLAVFDVPIFSDLNKIVHYPQDFGFSNSTTPCFSGSFDTPGTECGDPSDYVFWDGEHPTAAAHALTADVAYSVLSEAPDPIIVPEPATWAMIIIGFAGLGFAGWRARMGSAARTV